MKNTKNTVAVSLSVLAGIAIAGTALLAMGTPAYAEDALTRQLQVGSAGADVSTLQTFLASDGSVYPQGLVTGYFGFLTKAAVSNFQVLNGISSVGRVGPATLPVINLQIANGVGDVSAPVIGAVSVNAGRNAATLNWNTSEYATGKVYYSTSPIQMTNEQEKSVDVSGMVAMTDSSLRGSQSVSLSNLSPNTTYYFTVYSTDQSGNLSLTWPSSFQTSY